MFKRFLAALCALIAVSALAAVDVNKATLAELESVKGIGPGIAGKMLDERKKARFKDWTDMVERVNGVGDGNAAKFSAAGLTVNGQVFKGAPAKPAAENAAAKPATETTAVKPVTEKAAAKPVMDARPADKAEKAVAAAPAMAAEKPMAADKSNTAAAAASAAAKK